MERQLTYKWANNSRIEDVKEIQRKIFPNEDFTKACFSDAVLFPYLRCKIYFLVYDNNELIGITGMYEYNDYSDEAWLGWFGVVPEHRNKGYGRQILLDGIESLRKLKYKYLRLYTDINDNFEACKLYHDLGFKHECYYKENDTVGCLDLFSLQLNGDTTYKDWCNRDLHINEMNKVIFGNDLNKLKRPRVFMKG